MTRIELSIDELVLLGFDPRERYRISDAIARELEGDAFMTAWTAGEPVATSQRHPRPGGSGTGAVAHAVAVELGTAARRAVADRPGEHETGALADDL